MTGISGDGYSQTYQYNKLNLVEGETLYIDGKSLTLDYQYSPLGHLSAQTYPDNSAPVTYAPNAFGEATQVIRLQGQADEEVFVQPNAQYHANGIINTFMYGNDVVHTTAIDSLTNLPTKITDIAGATTHVNLTYSYDNNLNVTSITNPKDGNSYSLTQLNYDGLDRLISTKGELGIGDSNISYDALGNIRTYRNESLYDPSNLSYSYDADNRLIQVNDTELNENNRNFANGYDTRGNVTSNGNRSFKYNSANQMVSSGSSTFRYDGHNRRIRYQKNDGSIEYSMYSHNGQLLYRETKDGYINYLFLGDKLIAEEGDGIVDTDSSDMNYKPFGDSIEEAKDDVGYTGHKFDAELGLSYMQARYYDPVIGRFYSNDPVDALGHMQRGNSIANGFNRYAYANNSPYAYIDPDGQFGIRSAAAYRGNVPRKINHGSKESIVKGVANKLQETADTYDNIALASSFGGALTAPVTTAAGVMSTGAKVVKAQLSDNPTKETIAAVSSDIIPSKLVGKVTSFFQAVFGSGKIEATNKAVDSITSAASEAAEQKLGNEIENKVLEDKK